MLEGSEEGEITTLSVSSLDAVALLIDTSFIITEKICMYDIEYKPFTR